LGCVRAEGVLAPLVLALGKPVEIFRLPLVGPLFGFAAVPFPVPLLSTGGLQPIV